MRIIRKTFRKSEEDVPPERLYKESMILLRFLMVRDRLQKIVFFIGGAFPILVWTSAIISANDVEMMKHGVVKISAPNLNHIGTGVMSKGKFP